MTESAPAEVTELIIQDTEEGTGAEAVAGKTAVMHYTGYLYEPTSPDQRGAKFDSSLDRNQPFPFVLGSGMVIKGWDQGVPGMKVGGKRTLIIPPGMAYGERGAGGVIPPNATLVFDVELVSVVRMPKFEAPNADAQKLIEQGDAKGVKYEVLKVGTGEMCGDGDGVSVKYAIWKEDGTLLDCTERSGSNIAGAIGSLPAAFLKPLIEMCKVGEVLRAAVPMDLWNRAGADTVWRLELVSISKLPKFRALDKEKVVTTQSGLKYEVIESGDGVTPKATDKVVAHYTGWLTDGTVFDSSHARGEPSEFPLNRVIKGWTEGLQLMKTGGSFLFEIPSELAYGSRNTGSIPPNSTLIFLVELVEVK